MQVKNNVEYMILSRPPGHEGEFVFEKCNLISLKPKLENKFFNLNNFLHTQN